MPSEKSPDTAGLPLFDPDPAEGVNTVSAASDNNVEGAPIFPALGDGGMTDVNDLRGKLRKIEALFAGAVTPGERDAAVATLGRIKSRFADQVRWDPPIGTQFSLADQWSQLLFNALCRRYGLRPYRYKRQKRTTVSGCCHADLAARQFWPCRRADARQLGLTDSRTIPTKSQRPEALGSPFWLEPNRTMPLRMI